MQVNITLVANAGLLIEIDGKKLLMDGLHNQPQDALFSPVPPHILQLIMQGIVPFDGIRWLCFSHLHGDHFSLELVKAFLGMSCPEKLVLPKGLTVGELEELYRMAACDNKSAFHESFLNKSGKSVITEVAVPIGECQEMSLGAGIKLLAYPSRHAGSEYENVINLCLVLSIGEMKILFLGDADYDRDFLSGIAGDICFAAVVINPLFLHLPKGRKVLTKAIQTRQIIINHLPFEEHDKLNFRKMVSRDIELYKDILPPVTVLKDPLDSVCIT